MDSARSNLPPRSGFALPPSQFGAQERTPSLIQSAPTERSLAASHEYRALPRRRPVTRFCVDTRQDHADERPTAPGWRLPERTVNVQRGHTATGHPR